MALSKERKAELVKKFGKNEKDKSLSCTTETPAEL